MSGTTEPKQEAGRKRARLPGRLFCLGENMIELVVEGPGQPPEELLRRYLARPDDRTGPVEQWRPGSLSEQVSALLEEHGSDPAVTAGAEVRLCDGPFQVFVRVAGDAYDVAATAAALGTPAYLVSAVGDCPAGDFLVRWMEREGVRLDYCVRLPGTRVAVHFLVKGRKRYSRLGSAAARLPPEVVKIPYEVADFFHTFGGTTQMLSAGMRRVVREQVTRVADAGGVVSYNLNDRPELRPSREALLAAFEEVVPHLHLLFVGVDEAATVFGLDCPPAETPELSARNARRIQRALAPRCPRLRCLYVTDGKNGVHCFEYGQHPRHLPATLVRPEQVVEPVGAGDAFVGGVLHGLLCGLPHHRAAEVGAVTSQLNTLGHGAVVLPDPAQVRRHLAEAFHWRPELLRRI